MIALGSHLILYGDEWKIVLGRRGTSGPGAYPAPGADRLIPRFRGELHPRAAKQPALSARNHIAGGENRWRRRSPTAKRAGRSPASAKRRS